MHDHPARPDCTKSRNFEGRCSPLTSSTSRPDTRYSSTVNQSSLPLLEFRPRNPYGSSVTDNGPGIEAKRSIRFFVPTPDRRAAGLSATSLRIMKKPLTGSLISDLRSTRATHTPARLNTQRLAERPPAAPGALADQVLALRFGPLGVFLFKRGTIAMLQWRDSPCSQPRKARFKSSVSSRSVFARRCSRDTATLVGWMT